MPTSRRKNEIERSAAKERGSEILGVLLMALALMVTVSLISHSPDDPAWYFKDTSQRATQNLIGPVGAFLSEALLQLLGIVSYLLAFFLAIIGWNRFWCKTIASRSSKVLGLAAVLASLAGLLDLSLGEVPLKGQLQPASGAVGHLLAGYLASALNRAGAFILSVTVFLTSLVVATRWSVSRGVRGFVA